MTTNTSTSEKPKAVRKPKPLDPPLQAIMDEIAALPSLDGLMFANPHKQAKRGPEREALVRHMRLDRARWQYKSDKREARKEEKENA
jgi:hypothetical protein